MQPIPFLEAEPYTPTPVGKTRESKADCSEPRYTPTPVGKTVLGQTGCRLITVHPHACGENGMMALLIGAALGTPPRLWGKRPLVAA